MSSDHQKDNAVDPNAVFHSRKFQDYLSAALGQPVADLSIQAFEGGKSNPTYRLSMGAGEYVLRKKPEGELRQSAHAIDREYRVMAALGGTGIPLPKMITYCSDESLIGSEFFIMTYVPGRVMWDVIMPELDSEQRSSIFDSANDVISKLHNMDIHALGLGDFGRGGDYFKRQIRRWSDTYQSFAQVQRPAMEKVLDWINNACLPDDELSLVHGDYSFHNLLIDPSGNNVAAVLDWELSTIGHPLADFMYHCLEWYRPDGVDRRGTLLGKNLPELGIPTLDEYIALYCQRTGRLAIDNIEFHKAYNLFRMAAIAQGIAGRARAGLLSPDLIDQYEQRVEPFALASLEHAMKVDL